MPHRQDNAWKDLLRHHFPEFLAYFFPQVHAAIDWRRPIEFLDKELEPLIPEALRGKALVDKLVKVHLHKGGSALVFVHVEVLGYADPKIELRMLRYNVLIRERYGEEVISLLVLTDAGRGYRPGSYNYSRWGFRLNMRFPVVKLLDYQGRTAALERDPSIFAVVVLAALARIEAPGVNGLYSAKLRLVRLLYRRGHTKQEIRDLIRFLDWILHLPRELEREIIKQTRRLEKRRTMPYLSNIERWAIEKGMKKGKRLGEKLGLEKGVRQGVKQGVKQGLKQGEAKGLEIGERRGLLEALALGLELRFGAPGLAVLPRVKKIGDMDRLRKLVAMLRTATSLDEFNAVAGSK